MCPEESHQEAESQIGHDPGLDRAEGDHPARDQVDADGLVLTQGDRPTRDRATLSGLGHVRGNRPPRDLGGAHGGTEPAGRTETPSEHLRLMPK